MRYRMACVLACISGAGCDNGVAGPAATPLVVEAFLFAGAPVEDVRISEVIPLGSTDTVGTPVNDAEVVLQRGGTAYPLVPVGQSGTYHYAGNDLVVTTGDHFSLRVTRGGTTVTGQTIVPAPPAGLGLSKTTLLVPNLGGGGPPGGPFSQDSILVTWNNPAGEYYFLAIESLDKNAEYILPEQIRNFIGTFRLRLRPTTLSSETIRFLSLKVIGRHRATLYRVNKEYADLYENRTQDSRDLNEPPTNLTGGLGVFSAFNGQGTEFKVQRQ